MPNWSVTSQPKGVYISSIYNISNNLDRYLTTIKITLQNIHKQKVEFFFRISYDTYTWTEWEKFHEESYDLLNNHKLNGIYFQYKVVMVSQSEDKNPYLQSLNMDFKPFANIENIGDLPIKPKIWIKKVNGKGSIVLINHTTGQRIELKNLNNSEEVYIDCENEEIVSSNQNLGVYRYDSHNDEYLELIRGDNYLTSDGDFNLDVRYRGLLLQE